MKTFFPNWKFVHRESISVLCPASFLGCPSRAPCSIHSRHQFPPKLGLLNVTQFFPLRAILRLKMHLAAQDNPACFSSLHCIWQMSSAERMLRISLFIMSDHLAWAGPSPAAQWMQLEQGGAQADCWARSDGLPLAWRSQWSRADQGQRVPWGGGDAQSEAQLERERAQRALSQMFIGEPWQVGEGDVRPAGLGAHRDIYGKLYTWGKLGWSVQSQQTRPTKMPGAEWQDTIQRGSIFVCCILHNHWEVESYHFRAGQIWI